jgi:AraC family transcriptional regulator
MSRSVFLGDCTLSCNVAGSNVSIYRYSVPGELKTHRHERPYISFALRGSYSEDCQGQTVKVAVGTAIFHPKDEIHSNRIEAIPVSLLLIEPDASWLDHAVGEGFMCGRIATRDAEVARVASKLHRKLNDTGYYAGISRQGLVLELLAEIAAADEQRKPQPKQSVFRAREFVLAHHSEQIGLADVALFLGLHPTRLARDYRRNFGRSVGEEIRRMRVDSACRDLIQTDDSLSVIALRSGFYDQSHMTNIFRTHVGTSPSEFRRRTRGM